MLGSSHDTDDVVQETLLRAWGARDTLKDPQLLRPWLYRIATNACLDELKSRPKRVLASDAYPAAENPRAVPSPAIEEPVWLEPMPDTWMTSAGSNDPAARYALKESVALAFVAALQVLSPMQRATLLLRDVMGMTAEETAHALDTTVSAANSALFRARAAIEKQFGEGSTSGTVTTVDVDETLLNRYVRAFESADSDAFVALLHDDVQTTMPPSPFWLRGREANEAFYRHMFETRRHQGLRILRTAANGAPAFAYYRKSAPEQPYRLAAIQVLGIRDGRISRIHHFMNKEFFSIFDVPKELGDETSST
jgi:RNA polymerase sigma-70 factor (ECF subfamily)